MGRYLDFSLSLICQNPCFTSQTVNTLDFESSGSTSSVVGKGKRLLFGALFSGFRSIHILGFQFLFEWDHHSNSYSAFRQFYLWYTFVSVVLALKAANACENISKLCLYFVHVCHLLSVVCHVFSVHIVSSLYCQMSGCSCTAL